MEHFWNELFPSSRISNILNVQVFKLSNKKVLFLMTANNVGWSEHLAFSDLTCGNRYNLQKLVYLMLIGFISLIQPWKTLVREVLRILNDIPNNDIPEVSCDWLYLYNDASM